MCKSKKKQLSGAEDAFKTKETMNAGGTGNIRAATFLGGIQFKQQQNKNLMTVFWCVSLEWQRPPYSVTKYRFLPCFHSFYFDNSGQDFKSRGKRDSIHENCNLAFRTITTTC